MAVLKRVCSNAMRRRPSDSSADKTGHILETLQ